MNKAAGLLSEFYFDLIGRVVPGGCAFFFLTFPWLGFIYDSDDISESLVLFVVAYILGLLIDLVGDSEFLRLNRCRSCKTRNNHIVHRVLGEAANIEQPIVQSGFMKMCSELVFLRSLFLIFFYLSIASWILPSIGISFHTFQNSSHFNFFVNNLFWLAPVISLVIFIFFQYFKYRLDERLGKILRTRSLIYIR